jgi:uncharacterized membrane protein YfcA
MKTWQAFVMCIAVLTAGFVFATYKQHAPYTTLASAVGIVFAAYAGKRLWQKKEEFNRETVD